MACDLTLAAISRAVDALGTSGRRDGKGSKLGLLKTERDPTDDRFVLVFLTDKGKKMLQTLADITYGES
jgi:DNA-binding MarR family transcriptional regulator